MDDLLLRFFLPFAIIILSSAIVFSQPPNQSFDPVDGAYYNSPFTYKGIVYTQVAPTPLDQGISINYPGFFLVVNPNGSDAALCYDFESDGSSRPGPADFR
jgi:hypothetical protein